MIQIPNVYDFVADCTNAKGEWLDVYCRYTPNEYQDFEIIYVVGGTEDGGVVKAEDRYDISAECDVYTATAEYERFLAEV